MCAHLPAGIGIQSSNIHSKRSTSRTRKSAIRAARKIVVTRVVTTAASELNSQRLTFEFPAMIGYRRNGRSTTSVDINQCNRYEVCIPGTTSFASASLSYWIKPNPFISLTSTMVPLPCSLKKSSTSCLRAVERSVQRWIEKKTDESSSLQHHHHHYRCRHQGEIQVSQAAKAKMRGKCE